ncbi:helix-turn-helix domain-containing protein [Xanthocytophaga agilis]|uniref:Helix-turn-helix domain-containing protein n=1 Tax=Xanthocytophaga agilis TaxID=3048010 RepID=A0AAE3RDH5_9BACT|nr:helix-turn-helix domain-containing protein [Xanthocytophaga agilis]MDJ1505733.1 helix-turn-helix domain-containing protein [Xanthocytophaga agilis]
MEQNCIDIRDQIMSQKLVKSVADALYVIGGKWKLPIIIALFAQSKRFNDLKRAVEGISARVLSNELKDLEANGFIKRRVYAEDTPVTVLYELTEYSNSLEEVVLALGNWGESHLMKLKTGLKEVQS